jgi:putative NADH-flavin reductase
VTIEGDSLSISTVQDLLGTSLGDERFREALAAYADVLSEIRKLRSVDLTEVHPAVIFDPTARCRTGGDRRSGDGA